MRLKTQHIVLIAIFCTALLGVTLWAVYSEYDRPWKQYQKASGGAKINQIWLRELRINDRCTTCHQSADKKESKEAKQPYKRHSGDYLKLHPVEKFGCVICHDGEGEALTADAAHGEGKNRPQLLLRGQSAPHADSSSPGNGRFSAGKCRRGLRRETVHFTDILCLITIFN